MSENAKRGGISVQTEHIFPIIKKWLYSEKEIFLREIVSNACDAVTKLRRLSSLGEISGIDEDAFRIDVILDADAGTLTVRDNGIGMTEDELDRYICRIALSGALEFIEKYEGEGGGDGIIGHFGLGFYSSFMVSDTVDVITKSYTGAPAVKWVCTEAGEYEISAPDEDCGRGTSVVMHITDAEKEFLSASKIREILDKYCSFLPVPIYFSDGEGHECDCGHDHDEDHECDCECHGNSPVNDVTPLWQKSPSECTDEDYKNFYHKVFSDYREPLFHIHISADYPLNFKGILYFPRITNEYESLEGQVKLYYNQVFVADNIKEVIPEYLLMLRGVLDCPELPLNVSRSYLQNNSYVSKVSAHITKKVADKLTALFNNEHERYCEIWDDIKTFVEYGCIRDRKFYDRVKGVVLLPTTSGEHVTIDEYLDAAKERHDGKIYYCNSKIAEAQYISAYEAEGIKVVHLSSVIDTQFISLLEADKNCKFMRVDAGIDDVLKVENAAEVSGTDSLEALFKRVSGNEALTVEFQHLRDAKTPAVIIENEQSRRMNDMMRLYGMADSIGAKKDLSLTVNLENELIQKLAAKPDTDVSETVAKHIWSLARLSKRELSADEMKQFLAESYDILSRI